MYIKTGVALTGLLLANGCASIVSKSTWPVYLQTAQGETEFVVKNAYGLPVKTGVAPMLVYLESGRGWFQKANYTVTFNKTGYEAITEPLPARLNGWYFGNLLFGGLLGFLIVDPATGAMWELPETVSTSLRQNLVYQNGISTQSSAVDAVPPVPFNATPLWPSR